jgi:hypothetical protein
VSENATRPAGNRSDSQARTAQSARQCVNTQLQRTGAGSGPPRIWNIPPTPARPIPRSLADAKANSIPVIAYGQLITDMLSFTIVAAAVILVRGLHKTRSGRGRPKPLHREHCIVVAMAPQSFCSL